MDGLTCRNKFRMYRAIIVKNKKAINIVSVLKALVVFLEITAHSLICNVYRLRL